MADLFCATIVIPLFFGLAYLFADHIQTLWQWLRTAEMAVTGTLVVGAIAAYLVVHYVRKRRAAERAADDSAEQAARLAADPEKSVA
jgi:membrane protein DedA with SNARE-associated domain